MSSTLKKPTLQTYHEWQEAYDDFNFHLFGNALPECLILLDNKERRIMGYYARDRFVNPETGERTDAIAINPAYIISSPLIVMLQTLAHEMTHQWQRHFGEVQSKNGYHNKEWANKMESIGLMPSTTGAEGGKKTGYTMNDYPIPGGLFEKATQKLFEDKFKLTWADAWPVLQSATFTETQEIIRNLDLEPVKPKPDAKPQTRAKYTCPKCEANVWGRPGLNIRCGMDDMQFIRTDI